MLIGKRRTFRRKSARELDKMLPIALPHLGERRFFGLSAASSTSTLGRARGEVRSHSQARDYGAQSDPTPPGPAMRAGDHVARQRLPAARYATVDLLQALSMKLACSFEWRARALSTSEIQRPAV